MLSSDLERFNKIKKNIFTDMLEQITSNKNATYVKSFHEYFNSKAILLSRANIHTNLY